MRLLRQERGEVKLKREEAFGRRETQIDRIKSLRDWEVAVMADWPQAGMGNGWDEGKKF